MDFFSGIQWQIDFLTKESLSIWHDTFGNWIYLRRKVIEEKEHGKQGKQELKTSIKLDKTTTKPQNRTKLVEWPIVVVEIILPWWPSNNLLHIKD